jgi:hypothetical protein
MEKGMINKQLEDEKKKKDWEEKALSRLEEANLTVKKLFKMDAASRIQKDTIKEFFEKGDKNYTWIFDTISKFASDVDESLNDFSTALLSMRLVMKELSKDLRNRRPELVRFKDLEDSNNTQSKRKRKRTVNSDGDEEFCSPSPGKNPETSQGKPEKKEILVKVKVEMDSGMQEAQGPEMTLKEDIWAEMSTRPAPSGPMSTASREPATMAEGLATKDQEEGKL